MSDLKARFMEMFVLLDEDEQRRLVFLAEMMTRYPPEQEKEETA